MACGGAGACEHGRGGRTIRAASDCLPGGAILAYWERASIGIGSAIGVADGSPRTSRVAVPVLSGMGGAVDVRAASDCLPVGAILASEERASYGIGSAAGWAGVSIAAGGPLGRLGVGLSAGAAKTWSAGMRGCWFTLSHCGLVPHVVPCTISTFRVGRSWLGSLDCPDDGAPMRANVVGRGWSGVRLPLDCHWACVPERDAGHWVLVQRPWVWRCAPQ